jgi:DNA-binding MarR family transcriptional regulator
MSATVKTDRTPALAQRLRLVLARSARRLRQQGGADALSPSQAAALATVEHHGPLTPSELATCERISRPTATKVLGNLVAAGLVERTPDPGDRRSALVSVTQAGRERLNRMRRRKDAYLSEWLSGLSASDRATLVRAATILEKLPETAR